MDSPRCPSCGSPWRFSSAASRLNTVPIWLAFFLLALSAPNVFAQSTLSPSKLSFGNQPMGVASAAQTATFKNTQSTALTISSIAITGTGAADYSSTSNCPLSPSTLAASASCTIQVTFTPAALGSLTAKLTVTSSSSLSPQSVSLSGTGTAPVTLSSNSLSFGSVAVGNTSSAESVTLTNDKGSTLTFTSVAVSGAYAIASNTCSTSIAAGANCSVGVTFAPTTTGALSGTLTFTDNAANSPQTVSLSGSGTAPVTVSPTSLSFSSQASGTTSAAKTVTLTNHLNASLTVSAPTVTGDFVVSSNTCTTVAAGATCTIGVEFEPLAQGTLTGTLSIPFNAFGSPISVGLTGTGSAPVLSSIAVTPAAPSIPLGDTEQFTATGTYSDGSMETLTPTWSSSSTSVATISSAGLATSVATGSTTIKATSGSISGSTTLTITAPVLVSISVTPASPSIQLGKTQQFTATGTYSNKSTQNLTSSVTWSSSSTAVATINTAGLATSAGIGSTSIQATSGSIFGSTTLSVTAAGLVSISVTPTSPSVPLGTPEQFTATGTYTDGSQQNLTATVTWSSSAATVATVSAAGLASTVGTGSTTIKAVSGSLSSSTTLTVTAAALVSISVTPAAPSVTQGATQQFTATGTYTNNSTQNLTATATWGSSSTVVATINAAGLATTVGAGSTLISATSGSISGNTTLTVNPPVLLSIAVTPATPSIPLGNTQQFTATGTYNNGTQQNLTASATWGSSVTTVATIGATGLAASVGAGSSVITATSGSISGTATLTVTPPQLVSITLSPITPSIVDGNTEQFTATGNYTDGSTQNLTATATWSSSAVNVATISAGLATPTGVGSTTIKVTSGTISASTTLTVTAAPLVSISVTPATPSVPLGYTQQFTATGTDAAGNTQDLTSSVTWSSATTTVATITSAGVADGVGQGTSVITATSGSISGNVTLTVTPPQLVSIAVTPANPKLLLGDTQQFTAMGSYTDGSMQDLTSTATWASSATTVATINSAGLATAVGPTVTTISATSGSVTGSTGLTVALSETPTLVEHLSIAGSGGGVNEPYISFAMDPCLAGNLIVVPYTFSGGNGVKSVTVTDDKGDVFSYALPQPGQADSMQVTNIAYAPNCTAGASQITITLNGGTTGYVEAQASTFYNVATTSPFDGASSSAGDSAVLTSGSFTTSASGDLIYNYAVQDWSPVETKFSPGNGFSLLGVDLFSYVQQAAQYEVQGSAGTVNPSMTMSSAEQWSSVSVAFKAAPAGAAPTGMHIVHMLQVPLAVTTAPQVMQFPATGNLLAASTANGFPDTIAAMSDTQGNTWGNCASATYDLGGSTQIWYAGNATTGTNMTVSLTLVQDMAVDVVFLYDIAGAAPSPCDTQAQAPSEGYSQSPASSIATSTVTPDTPNGLILWSLSVDTDTVPGLLGPAGAIFDSVYEGITEQDDPANQNDGWAHYYNSTTSPVTFTIPPPQQGASQIYGGWVAIAVPFEAFTGTNPPAINSLSATSGTVGTSITIAGANFGSAQGTGTVTFNGAPATVTSWGPNQIVVTVPTAATTGYVVVTTSGGVSNGMTFTVTASGG